MLITRHPARHSTAPLQLGLAVARADTAPFSPALPRHPHPAHASHRSRSCVLMGVPDVAVLRGALIAVLVATLEAPTPVRAAASMYPDLADFKRGLKANAQRCANAHRVQYLQVMAMMEAPMRTGYDRNSKCFVCCLMERYQMLTPDGEFMDGTMHRYATDLPESQFKTVVVKNLDTCLREDNDDVCEKCYQFAKCYYDRAKVKQDGSKWQSYQKQQLNNYYQGSSGKFFQSVGNWANSQWHARS